MEKEKRNPTESELIMEHMVVDSLTFERHDFQQKEGDVGYQFAKHVEKIDDGQYNVYLAVKAEKSNEYTAEVKMIAFCRVKEGTVGQDVMLNENAIAIMMPYARAQLSLLTSQPETTPIAMPILNVHELVKEMDTAKAAEEN